MNARQLTGPAWDSREGVAYAVIEGDRVEPGSVATLTVRNALLSSVSTPTGTVGSAPPLEPDGTWDCTGTDELGYTCTTVADESGTVIAAVEATESGLPVVSSNQLTVELTTESGSSSDQLDME